MRSIRLVFVLVLVLGTFVCSSLPAVADPPVASSTAPDVELAGLAERMAGVFSSAAQAKGDADFRDVRLVMLAIWPERNDGPWLYVEQAIAASLEQPYRQRVYRLRRAAEGGIESVVYTLPGDPLRFAGAWRRERPLGEITPSELVERTGCAIHLARRADGTWAGSTGAKSCPSDLRGAAYATSEVEIAERLLVSWDRGFAADGKQVWGAEKGGYRFDKIADRP